MRAATHRRDVFPVLETSAHLLLGFPPTSFLRVDPADISGSPLSARLPIREEKTLV